MYLIVHTTGDDADDDDDDDDEAKASHSWITYRIIGGIGGVVSGISICIFNIYVIYRLCKYKKEHHRVVPGKVDTGTQPSGGGQSEDLFMMPPCEEPPPNYFL